MLHRPFSFAATFLALFALVFVFMWAADALPDATTPGEHPAQQAPAPAPVATNQNNSPELPVRVVAKDIGLDVAVVNPATTSPEVLDKALEQGAVRYPTSAPLGVNGTMLLFGHSSYLPIVYHQYYKTFDGIQNLKKGEIVSVYSGGVEYRYAVTLVHLANAQEDVIELPQDGKYLVLVTCDSFATKSTRYVVHADFEGAFASAE
jgi:LPXTG-site transpeptidase (sortase) family protein